LVNGQRTPASPVNRQTVICHPALLSLFSVILFINSTKVNNMQKLIALLIAVAVTVSLQAQNVGVGETNPKAMLEIKSSNASADTSAFLVRNNNNDTLFKASNHGSLVIGSIQKDFGQLQIINNGRFNPNLLLTGTDFGNGTGLHNSELVFNGVNTDRFWRVGANVYTPLANLFTQDSRLHFYNDSISNVLTLKGDGKIGMGTGAPKGFLEVRNDAGGTDITPQLNLVGTGIASRSYLYFSASDNLNYWYMRGQHNGSFANFLIGLTNNPAAIAINEASQIFMGGVSTTPRAQINIGHNSTVANAQLALYETDANDYARMMFFNSGNSDNWQIAGLTNSTPANARLNFYTNTFGDVMSLTGDGKVGIGTGAPLLGGLVVDTKAGAVNAMFGSNTSGVAIESSFPGVAFNCYFNGNRKYISAGYGAYAGLDPALGMFIIASTSASGSAGATAALTNRLLVANSGEVGINKTPATGTSDSKLQVKQTGTQNGIGIEAAGSGNHWDWYVNASNQLVLNYNGVTKGTFDNVGGGYTANSDRRLKKDIAPLPGATPKLMALTGYQYHYTDNHKTDPLSIGFMAQEVQQIFPDAVRPINMQDGTQRLGINYQYFTVLAIKSLQEQQQQIVLLEQRLKKLEQKAGYQQ
jgi:Chaperone of endosialidase